MTTYPNRVMVKRHYIKAPTSGVIVACLEGEYLFRHGFFTAIDDQFVEVFIPATRERLRFRKSSGQQTIQVSRRKYRIKPFREGMY